MQLENVFKQLIRIFNCFYAVNSTTEFLFELADSFSRSNWQWIGRQLLQGTGPSRLYQKWQRQMWTQSKMHTKMFPSVSRAIVACKQAHLFSYSLVWVPRTGQLSVAAPRPNKWACSQASAIVDLRPPLFKPGSKHASHCFVTPPPSRLCSFTVKFHHAMRGRPTKWVLARIKPA